MNARDQILNAIRRNKPAVTDTTMQVLPLNGAGDLVEEFCRMLQSIGGQVIRIPDMETLRAKLEGLSSTGLRIVNTVPEIGPLSTIHSASDAVSLSDIENTYLKSSLGIAENGAIWLTEEEIGNRLIPFITQHLTILLHVKDLVPNMHEAYAKISGTDSGYHVFIAGPSKTADIEQSLVIGAHGPRSMLVYLIG